MKKVTVSSSVLNGVFKRNRNIVLNAIKSFEGKNIVITIDVEKSKRSLNQNAYYWGVVIPIVKSGLFDMTNQIFNNDEVHYQILLEKFGVTREIVNQETGETISIKIGSSDMNKTEFSDYIMRIQEFGSSFLNVDIPSPNENLLLFN